MRTIRTAPALHRQYSTAQLLWVDTDHSHRVAVAPVDS
jgi:hypothetical protein